MPDEKSTNVVQGRTMELRKLKAEERMLEKLISESSAQLTKLQVEAVEIKMRMSKSNKSR